MYKPGEEHMNIDSLFRVEREREKKRRRTPLSVISVFIFLFFFFFFARPAFCLWYICDLTPDLSGFAYFML